jgi:L-threonylcarbamoyladenylate synthase
MSKVSLDTLVTNVAVGAVVSFPTDTVPALAVKPEFATLIFEIKQRSSDKPLILMGATSEDLWPFVEGRPAELQVWRQVAQTYWPGPLTLVLPASKRLPPQINPSNPTTIGIRVPDDAIAQLILSRTGPLATTSANLSGQPPLETLDAIDQQFPQVLVLDASSLKPQLNLRHPRASSGIPSTVAQWNGHTWNILRQGPVVSL